MLLGWRPFPFSRVTRNWSALMHETSETKEYTLHSSRLVLGEELQKGSMGEAAYFRILAGWSKAAS